MNKFRPWIRRFHRVSGLIMGFPFGVICLTGILLLFEPQILRFVHADYYYRVSLPSHPQSCSIVSVSRKVEGQLPEGMTLGGLKIGKAGDAWIYEVASMRKAELFVDPYQGKILGLIDHDRGFFFQIRKIHRWLGDTLDRDGDALCWGRVAVGVVSLWSVLMVLSGFYLWFPRSRSSWKIRFRWPWSMGVPYARYYQKHSWAGLFCGIPVVALALTGLTWSFSWYCSAFYSVLGADYSKRKILQEVMGRECWPLWDQALHALKQRHGEPSWVFFQDSELESGFDTHFPGICSVQRYVLKKGHVCLYEYPSATESVRKIRSAVVAVHEGIWLGIVSQILTLLWVLSACYLVWSGYRMYRFRKQVCKEREKRKSLEKR